MLFLLCVRWAVPNLFQHHSPLRCFVIDMWTRRARGGRNWYCTDLLNFFTSPAAVIVDIFGQDTGPPFCWMLFVLHGTSCLDPFSVKMAMLSCWFDSAVIHLLRQSWTVLGVLPGFVLWGCEIGCWMSYTDICMEERAGEVERERRGKKSRLLHKRTG